MSQPHFRQIAFCLLPLLGIAVAKSAIALPMQVAQQPGYMDQFYNYLNQQKYTLRLGESRGACAYSIDPSDIYQQGNSRFLTAKLSRGDGGTACQGLLEFRILQADCQTKTLYEFVRESTGELRLRGWQRLEMSLRDPNQRSAQNLAQQSAIQICKLPTRAGSTSNR